MLNNGSERHQRNTLCASLRYVLLNTNSKRNLPGGDHDIRSAGTGKYNFHIESLFSKVALVLGNIQSGMVRIRAPVKHYLYFLKRCIVFSVLGSISSLIVFTCITAITATAS
ncbi:hypothetical protein D3C76_1467020 [compost metagenome]